VNDAVCIQESNLPSFVQYTLLNQRTSSHNCTNMTRLTPVQAIRHARPGTFVHKDLRTCTHVFLRQPRSGASLQRPLPSHISQRENTTTACSRQTHHSVNRQGQTGLHFQQGQLHAHHLQPCGQNNAYHSTDITDRTSCVSSVCQYSTVLLVGEVDKPNIRNNRLMQVG
jgi:hypothetical protein